MITKQIWLQIFLPDALITPHARVTHEEFGKLTLEKNKK